MPRIDTRILTTLLFAIFVTVTGVGIVVPLLPIYAHDLGASGIYIGMIFGAFSISRTVFLPYFGRLSDKKGRKVILLPGLLCYTLISVAYIYMQDVTGLILIRFVHGVASAMIMPVIQAYVGDITPPGREGRFMGLHSMSLLFGLSAGPLIGGVIKDSWGLQAAFSCMGALSLVSFIACLLLLPPAREERVVQKDNRPVPWKSLIGDRAIVGLFGFRYAFVVSIGVIWAFLPLYADLELSLKSSSIGILIMLGVLISGLLNVPMGYLADRVNKRAMVVFGGASACLAVLAYQMADSYGELIFASVLFGIGGGTSMPALNAMAVLKGNKVSAMGSVMALLTMGHSLGMMTGALLGGAMMDLFDLRIAFITASATLVLGIIVFFIGTHSMEDRATPKPNVVDPSREYG